MPEERVPLVTLSLSKRAYRTIMSGPGNVKDGAHKGIILNTDLVPSPEERARVRSNDA